MVDYKTIVSTSADKTTLLHWLKSLVAEFGQAKIADIAFTNDGNSTLTFTFTLEDGSKKTATCSAFTLTSDEKKLITEMQKTVTASDEGVTFNQAVTFAGNVVFKGNEIHNGYVSLLGNESHAGSELHKGESTFTDLKTDSITSTDGQELLTYDGTNTAIKGKGTRPLYNDGEMALLSDVGGASAIEFWAYFGNHRWDKRVWSSSASTFSDPLLKYCTSYASTFAYFSAEDLYGNARTSLAIENGTFNDNATSFVYCFSDINITDTLTLPSFKLTYGWDCFLNCKCKKVLVADGGTVYCYENCTNLFRVCPNLEEVGKFDFSNANYSSLFVECPKLKSIHCTHLKYSFDISSSTQFEEADLVEILNNLDTVSTTQTLTMGSTNLAKLTSDEILIATGKGWALN